MCNENSKPPCEDALGGRNRHSAEPFPVGGSPEAQLFPVSPQWQQRGHESIDAGDLVLMLGVLEKKRFGMVLKSEEGTPWVWAMVDGKAVKHMRKLCLFCNS